jgi:large subunit ribosomal protein L6
VSRVGKKPIAVVSGVKVKISDHQVTVAGPKGELAARLPESLGIELKDNQLIVSCSVQDKAHRALHGLWRALLQNMVNGVVGGYTKKLELVGVGYRAEMRGKKLQLLVGYSHPILFVPPEGIVIQTPTQTNIVITGIDKQLVGQVAAKIRSFRPPEPYKGKGIKYEDEFIRRKAGKAAAAAGTK